MFSDARRHMMYRIANAPVLAYPFPHMVATDVLPPGLFRHALAMLPGDEAYTGFGTAGRRTLHLCAMFIDSSGSPTFFPPSAQCARSS